MHNTMVKVATHEQLKTFVCEAMGMIKGTNHELYEELEDIMYQSLYGCHFTDWSLEHALKDLENVDGTRGGHWSLEQTNSVAKQYSIKFNKFNEYDWCYVMNMIYSDYFGSINNETQVYAKLANAFLNDTDAKEGKAYRYYMAMK